MFVINWQKIVMITFKENLSLCKPICPYRFGQNRDICNLFHKNK